MQTLLPADVTYERVAKTIDHSLLRPELTLEEIREGCELAARYHVASVCVRPPDVTLVAGLLADSDVEVGTVARGDVDGRWLGHGCWGYPPCPRTGRRRRLS